MIIITKVLLGLLKNSKKSLNSEGLNSEMLWRVTMNEPAHLILCFLREFVKK